MQIGDLIKQKRTAAGMTQSDLAKALHVTPQAVSQYERNVKTPKLETVTRIAEALNCLVPDLYPEGMYSLPILEHFESRGISILGVPPTQYGENLQPANDAKENMRVHYERMWRNMENLNEEGQRVAVERVEELAQIPKYQRQPAGDTAQDVPDAEPNTDPTQK